MTRRKVLLELAAIVMVLLTAESGYRAYKLWRYGIVDYPDLVSVGYFRTDPVYGMVARPNFSSETMVPAKIRTDPSLRFFYGSRYTTNGWGYRGREFSEEKAPGTFRIVVLGDSVTMGVELNDDETWPAQLEARVPGAEVINAANGGWRSREGLIRLKEEVTRLKPDLVLVAFGMTDVTMGAGGSDPDSVNPQNREWWRKSKLAENLYIRSMAADSGDRAHQDQMRSRIVKGAPWARSLERNLLEMKRVADGMGARMQVIQMPSLCRAEALGTEEYRQVVSRTRVTEADYLFWVEAKKFVGELLQDLRRREGLEVVDLVKSFERFGGEQRLSLFADEVHLTPAGARAIADAIQPFLSQPLPLE